MTMGRMIMAPLRFETIGIDSFDDRPAISASADREDIATTFDTAKQQTFMVGQSDPASAVVGKLAAPHEVIAAALYVTVALNCDVRLTWKRDR